MKVEGKKPDNPKIPRGRKVNFTPELIENLKNQPPTCCRMIRPKEPMSREIQTIIKPTIRCRWCGSSDVRNNGKKGNIIYYRCNCCIEPDTGKPTAFKVQIINE